MKIGTDAADHRNSLEEQLLPARLPYKFLLREYVSQEISCDRAA
jgi:hypothetical protein